MFNLLTGEIEGIDDKKLYGGSQRYVSIVERLEVLANEFSKR
jgi:hypothetical protein